MAVWLILSQLAVAGEGPWTLSPGDATLYVGTDYYRFDAFKADSSQPIEVGTPVIGVRGVGVWSMGLADGVDVELRLPMERVRVVDPSSVFCTDGRSEDWCDTTMGVGDLFGRVKFRVLDEFYGYPLSVSAGGGLRTGEFYTGTRHRLTTLGDGQTDLGAWVSAGRTDVLGDSGWYRVTASAWYWFRTPVGELRDRRVPGDELSYTVEGAFSLGYRVSLGPVVHGFHRLWGVSLKQADFDYPDVWASLEATRVDAGAKLGISSDRGVSMHLSALRTIYARNNPSNAVAVSAGIGWFFAAKD